MCCGRRSRDCWISCLINPSAGREGEWGADRFARAADPRRSPVVGAGPVALDAARVAAERAHRVEVAKAADQIGGHFRLAGMQPRRVQISNLMGRTERQFDTPEVTLRARA